jgi:aminoglycoside 3-N-acetyltransferase
MKASIRRFVPAGVWKAARKIKHRLELRKIKAEGPPITKDQLVRDLRALGITEGDAVYVHSSLRALGFVEGGPDAVVDALMEAVGPDGTLAFPTFTLKGGMKESLESGDYVFDPRNTPSTVGAITNAFRLRPGVFRSLHPTHSVAVWGRLAKALTESHLEQGSNFGVGSPFAKLLDLDVKILGIGVDYRPITYYHVYEDLNPDKFPGVYLPRAYVARIKLENGYKEVLVRCHDPEFHRRRIDKNPEIESYFSSYFESEGVAHVGRVGKSMSWWLYAKDVIACLDKLYSRGITIYRTPNLKK